MSSHRSVALSRRKGRSCTRLWLAMSESRVWASIGPPAPPVAGMVVRALQAAVTGAALIWVALLGGVRFSPRVTDPATGANDTGGLFNWHPLLMLLAFPLAMAEAVLAYRAPLAPAALPERPARKAYHAALHTLAAVAAVLGLVAAVKSHTAKRPDPIPNLYSVHSWLGLLVLVAFAGQYALGVAAFVAPAWSQANRAAFGPVHAALGLAVFFGGAAAAVAGLQEKATFVQVLGKAGVGAAVMRMPALLGVLLAALAAAVGWHHAPGAAARAADADAALQRLDAEEQPFR